MALMADYLDRMIVNTILVAVDGSPASVQAARAAVGFAHDHVSKVVVLAFAAAADDAARDCAHMIGEYAQKARIPCEMGIFHTARPAEDIVAEARRRHCDLIWLSAPAECREEHRFDVDLALEVLGKSDVPVMLFRSRAGIR